MRAVFGLYGNNITLVAHGDDGILKHLLISPVVKDAVYFILDAGLGGFEFAADAPKFHAGIFAHIAMLVNDVIEIAFQLAQNFQRARPFLQNRGFQFQIPEEILDGAHGIHGAHDVLQFFKF